MSLSSADIAHIKTLREKLRGVLKPSYGYADWYTVGAGGWAAPLAPGVLIDIRTSLSGVSAGSLPDWALEASEQGARKDAEMHLALAYDDELTRQTGGNAQLIKGGTLYIVTDKGPCRSCRNVLKALRRHWDFRLVVFYTGSKLCQGHVGQQGIEDASEHDGGYYSIFE